MKIIIEKNIDVNAIIDEMGIDKESTMTYITTRFRDYCEPFVPKSNGYIKKGLYIPPGQLREQTKVYVESDTGYIEYIVPYALYQYYGQRQDGSHVVKNYTTPGTGKYWDNLMMSAVGDQYIDEIENYIGGNIK